MLNAIDFIFSASNIRFLEFTTIYQNRYNFKFIIRCFFSSSNYMHIIFAYIYIHKILELK